MPRFIYFLLFFLYFSKTFSANVTLPSTFTTDASDWIQISNSIYSSEKINELIIKLI